MKRFLLILAAATALYSCQILGVGVEIGNGISVDNEIHVRDFDSIAIIGSLDVIYTRTPGEQAIVLTCDENLASFYQIKVEGSTLVVTTKPGLINIRPTAKSYVTVHSPGINGVTVTGSGDCVVTNAQASSGEFVLKVTGSGDIRTDGTIDCSSFSTVVTGSGSIDVADVLADKANLKVSGSGDINIDLITADAISAVVSGSGDITFNCKNAGTVEVSITGSGNIRVRGDAESFGSKISGSGHVDSRSLYYRQAI